MTDPVYEAAAVITRKWVNTMIYYCNNYII